MTPDFDSQDFNALFNPAPLDYLGEGSPLAAFDPTFYSSLDVVPATDEDMGPISPDHGQGVYKVMEHAASALPGPDRSVRIIAEADDWTSPNGPDSSKIASTGNLEALLELSQDELVRQSSVRSRVTRSKRAPQPRLPIEAVEILEETYRETMYPTKKEFEALAKRTSQTVRRVRTWFNNSRQRKKGQDESQPSENNQTPAARLSRESLEEIDKNPDSSLPLPMESFLASDAIPSSNSALAQAVKNSDSQKDFTGRMTNTTTTLTKEPSPGGTFQNFRGKMPTRRVSRPASVASSLPSSSSSVGSHYSISSCGSHMSAFSRTSRKGRRKHNWRAYPYHKPKIDDVEDELIFGNPMIRRLASTSGSRFFCTFCGKTCSNQYEWKRHEATVHAPQDVWICCDWDEDNSYQCDFCEHAVPDSEHIASHCYQHCSSKPENERTFYRRDQFVQHLHGIHYVGRPRHHTKATGGSTRRGSATKCECSRVIGEAHRKCDSLPAGHPNLHCGFCGVFSTTWDKRCRHVATHFEEDGELNRSTWWPERRATNGVHTMGIRWSCGLLRSPGMLIRFDIIQSPVQGSVCILCDKRGTEVSLEHVESCHRPRSCDQLLYSSFNEFRQHMEKFHRSNSFGDFHAVDILYRNQGPRVVPKRIPKPPRVIIHSSIALSDDGNDDIMTDSEFFPQRGLLPFPAEKHRLKSPELLQPPQPLPTQTNRDDPEPGEPANNKHITRISRLIPHSRKHREGRPKSQVLGTKSSWMSASWLPWTAKF